eukprot:CAMPEP_0114376536 /NCGR_PEP_ID=MMETSP0102-20121206/429_1 /TAXON_ID=38822 ORGANISM="Pteridomonas danica, Strain PT" /NCGR_SAMPLE_ID=MMETSP0102 /ASSEMBLY_ACC=CAM_ASM_000212 /LENGTH=492 /DNA_ID=CAMNT_0001530879 /DNA_START=1028 /DNA_END=2506 /DNA_ORIENTATION=-
MTRFTIPQIKKHRWLHDSSNHLHKQHLPPIHPSSSSSSSSPPRNDVMDMILQQQGIQSQQFLPPISGNQYPFTHLYENRTLGGGVHLLGYSSLHQGKRLPRSVHASSSSSSSSSSSPLANTAHSSSLSSSLAAASLEDKESTHQTPTNPLLQAADENPTVGIFGTNESSSSSAEAVPASPVSMLTMERGSPHVNKRFLGSSSSNGFSNSNSNNNNNNNNSSSREQPYEDELENNHHENGDGVIRGGVRDLDDEISLITNSDDMVNNPPSSSSSSIITHQNDENNNDHNDDDDDVYKWHVMTTIKATKYLADEVILGGSYIFRIRARNSLGWSKYGPSSKPIIVFRVLPPLPPSQLINEKSGKLCSPGVTFLKLSWKPPPGKPASEIDSYEMEFCDEKSGGGDGLSAPSSSSSSSNGIDNNDNDDGGGGGRWSAISIIGGPTTIKGAGIEKPNIILQGLLPGHKYTFRIRALAFEGWTDWSIASDVMSTDRRF